MNLADVYNLFDQLGDPTLDARVKVLSRKINAQLQGEPIAAGLAALAAVMALGVLSMTREDDAIDMFCDSLADCIKRTAADPKYAAYLDQLDDEGKLH